MKEADRNALIAGEVASTFVEARLIDGITDEPVDRGFVRLREGRITSEEREALRIVLLGMTLTASAKTSNAA